MGTYHPHALPWETVTGFIVSDDTIILHRPFPRPDVRWSRADIIETELEIIESLTDHLDRRT